MPSIVKNDIEAINTIESEFYFMSAMGIDVIPSEATLRQRMNERAVVFLPIIEKASQDFLKSLRPDLQPLSTGHIPLDADVTPMDNGSSQKEGCRGLTRGVMAMLRCRSTWGKKATAWPLSCVRASSIARKTRLPCWRAHCAMPRKSRTSPCCADSTGG